MGHVLGGQYAALYYLFSVLRALADLPGNAFDEELFAMSDTPADVGRAPIMRNQDIDIIPAALWLA